MTGKLVILDRDGVINVDSPDYIKSPAEWHPIPGSLEAIAQLHRSGYQVYVATNQAGVARGKLDLAKLAAIHSRMLDLVSQSGGRIDGIVFCPHHPDEGCLCRKPKPGMLLEICERSLTSPERVYFVGDSEKDIIAAEAAGCQPVLVLTGNGKATREQRPDIQTVFPDLLAFVTYLLGAGPA